MKLNLESLRCNILGYVRLAEVVKGLFDECGVGYWNFSESMEACRKNLNVLEGLLADGISELEIPEKPR